MLRGRHKIWRGRRGVGMLDDRHSARSAYQPVGAAGRRSRWVLFVHCYGMAGQSIEPHHRTAAVSCASVAKSIASSRATLVALYTIAIIFGEVSARAGGLEGRRPS